MKKVHIIESGVVVNSILATLSEAQAAYPNATCVETEYGGIGWLWDGVVLTPPPVVVAPQPILVSPVEFMLLFTSPERVAIKALRQTDPIIDDFLDIIEDPRLTFVDLGLGSTVSAIDYLIYVGLVAPERKAEILTGVML